MKRFLAVVFVLAIAIPLTLPDTAIASAYTVAYEMSTPVYTRTLKLGSRGTDVAMVQQKLNDLSCSCGKADGMFGKQTQAAVKAFQSAHSLKSDGIVGNKTFNALFCAEPAGTGTETDTGTGTGTDTGTGSSDPYTVDGYKLGKLNNQVTLKKGSKGVNVKDLQAVLKLKGFYSGKIDGSFQSSTQQAVKKFQSSVRLTVDGIAGNYTLSALYTMLNPPDLTTIIPWPDGKDAYSGIAIEKPKWPDTNTKIWKKGVEATIVDVRSGYVFRVKRTGGSNHADVETITSADTATFYKSAGSFSWARRPIWVIVNGRRLAASMNCMPHGYDTLSANDFKGQFCIHFVGSKTHGTNRVDPDHQACIEEAYEAGLASQTTPTPKP